MNTQFNSYLLQVTDALSSNELQIIQSLWSGYGKISRYAIEGSKYKRVVVKHIVLNQSGEHPRGWDSDLSHNRKVKSYQVETNWY